MTTSFTLRTLSHDDILKHLSELTDILVSCVNGGASVSFMLPFAPETATAFSGCEWRKASPPGSALSSPRQMQSSGSLARYSSLPTNRKTNRTAPMSPSSWFTKMRVVKGWRMR